MKKCNWFSLCIVVAIFSRGTKLSSLGILCFLFLILYLNFFFFFVVKGMCQMYCGDTANIVPILCLKFAKHYSDSAQLEGRFASHRFTFVHA